MKKLGLAVLFLLLAGTTGISVRLLLKSDSLADKERTLRMDLNSAKSLLKEQADQIAVLQSAKDRLLVTEANATTTLSNTSKALKTAQDELTQSLKLRSEAEAAFAALKTAKAGAESDLAAAKASLASSQKDKTDLTAAAKRVQELQKEIENVNGKIESQKLILADLKVQIDEYNKVGLSPSQVRKLQDEHAKLKAGAAPAVSTLPGNATAPNALLPPASLPPAIAPLTGRKTPKKNPTPPLP